MHTYIHTYIHTLRIELKKVKQEKQERASVPSMEKGKAVEEDKALGGIITIRMPRIPVFSGKDAYLWVNQVEDFFNANPTMNDRDKFRAAIAALQEPASTWYADWKKYTSTDINWSSFRDAVLQRFQPEAINYPYLPLLNLRQKGTVEEYRELFETLSTASLRHLVKNVSEDISMAIFLNGLREDLKSEPRLHQKDVKSLSDLMEKARIVEEEIVKVEEEAAELKKKLKPSPYLRMWGEIAGRKVIVLVSTGVCENRIVERVVKELGLAVSECGEGEEVSFFRIGEQVKSQGVCKGVKVRLHKHLEITQDFFMFEDLPGREDVVLGFDWIQSNKDVTVTSLEDALTVKLNLGQKSLILKGDPSLPHIQQHLVRSAGSVL